MKKMLVVYYDGEDVFDVRSILCKEEDLDDLMALASRCAKAFNWEFAPFETGNIAFFGDHILDNPVEV